jgi:hypothetical protein
MVYADDVNLLGNNINLIKKNREAATDAIKEVHQEVNTGKMKNILMSAVRMQGEVLIQRQLIDALNMWQNSYLCMTNKSEFGS